MHAYLSEDLKRVLFKWENKQIQITEYCQRTICKNEWKFEKSVQRSVQDWEWN